MEANNNAMRKALTDLVNYLNKEIKRTSKCKRCKYRGKSFRGEPCYWHVDCGIEDYDKKASNNAMYLLKRFKLQKALASPPRNCDRFADELDAQLAFLNEVWLISIDRETMTEQDAYENWTDEMRTRYGRWLFALATEQKGEINGSK